MYTPSWTASTSRANVSARDFPDGARSPERWWPRQADYTGRARGLFRLRDRAGLPDQEPGRQPPVAAFGRGVAEEEQQDGDDEGAAADGHQHLVGIHQALFRRRLLVSTETLENDIAAAATIGLISQPVNG